MKKNLVEYKSIFLAMHQVFTVCMAISIYSYDYSILKNPQKNEIGYLMVAIVCAVCGFSALIAYGKAEKITIKKHKKGFWDQVYVEPLCIMVAVIVLLLILPLAMVDLKNFSLAGLVVAVGTICYLMDSVLVMLGMNLYRRHLRKELRTGSLLYHAWLMSGNFESGKGFREISKRAKEQSKLREALNKIADGEMELKLNTEEFHGQELEMAIAINRIQDSVLDAVEARTKDERMKADLITNVSHDIKTPLTSIINYVELLQREKLDNENAEQYVRIIDEKAHRLKTLTEDLVEVSKISSGNIKLDIQVIDFLELLYQTGGEFNERFEARGLTIVTKLPNEPVFIKADGRQVYRSIENLYINAAKYAKANTKVYVELAVEKQLATFTIKNMTETLLETQSRPYVDLTERFVRGEVSRTTEGSGLGLSIAKSLTELMGGRFTIRIEGDVFEAQVQFPIFS